MISEKYFFLTSPWGSNVVFKIGLRGNDDIKPTSWDFVHTLYLFRGHILFPRHVMSGAPYKSDCVVGRKYKVRLVMQSGDKMMHRSM